MITTNNHIDTITADLQTSGEFRRAFLAEAIIALASGDLVTGKLALNIFVNATLGLPELAKSLNKSELRLRDTLDPASNLDGNGLFEITGLLQRLEGSELRFEAIEKAA